jgi:N-acetylglucosamine-6-phosphate deacetylase
MHITHLYNVCNFHHRNIGLTNVGLLSEFPYPYEKLIPPSIEVIADLVHVHPLALKLAILTRSKDLAIITDSIIEKNSKETIHYCGRDLELVDVNNMKKVLIKNTTTIAGSCSNQLDMFHNLLQKMNVSLLEAVNMLSYIPSKIANIDSNIGEIAEGKDADLNFFDSEYNLINTTIKGEFFNDL